MQHDLKVWPEYFRALAHGKRFEVRKNDRNFQVGDELLLREYAPGPDEYTGQTLTVTVNYILSGDDPMGYAFGIRPGFCVLSING